MIIVYGTHVTGNTIFTPLTSCMQTYAPMLVCVCFSHLTMCARIIMHEIVATSIRASMHSFMPVTCIMRTPALHYFTAHGPCYIIIMVVMCCVVIVMLAATSNVMYAKMLTAQAGSRALRLYRARRCGGSLDPA